MLKLDSSCKCNVCRCIKEKNQFASILPDSNGKLICKLCDEKRCAASEVKDKTCTKCKCTKAIEEFGKDASYSSGHKARCKQCSLEDKAISKQKSKTMAAKEQPLIKEKACSDCKKVKAIELFDKDKNYASGRSAYCSECRRARSRAAAPRRKTRYATDTNYKMKCILRSRIITALTRKKLNKATDTMSLTSCSIDDLCEHIEKQFDDSMTWKTHGSGPGKWNIDHVLPCNMFNLEDEFEQRRCFHFTNLQPLWYSDNAEKAGSFELDDCVLSSLYRLFDSELQLWSVTS